MAHQTLPDPNQRWDLDRVTPDDVVAECVRLRQVYGEVPGLARVEVLDICRRTAATVRFLLREEPYAEASRREWLAGLTAWRRARSYSRRVLWACEQAIADRRPAAVPVPIRLAA